MVTDDVWDEAGLGCGYLCIACLESRLGRYLTREDFEALPLNDDEECDSVRLRSRKGSGRASERLCQLGIRAVVELGLDAPAVAASLGLDTGFLEGRVAAARLNLEFLAMDDNDEGTEADGE